MHRGVIRGAATRLRGAGLPMVLFVFLGVDAAMLLPSDASIYHRFASHALASPLLRTLPREYPAASVGIFVLPLLLPLPYNLSFTVVAVVASLALLASSDGLATCPGWSRRASLYALLGTVGVAFSRYDIFPAATAFAAVECARRGKWGRGWAWAVGGGLLKLFPFVLLPGFFLLERRLTGRFPWARAFSAGAVVSLVAVVQSVVAPGSFLSPVRYQLDRGFQLGSTGGSLTFLTDPLHVRWGFAFGAWQDFGSFASAISLALLVVTVVGLGAVWACAGRGRLSVEAASLAALSVCVVGDKAFSPQYMLWLIPLWAYWPLRKGWLAAAGLCTLVFPVLFLEAAFVGPGFYWATGAAVARNLVLTMATAQWLRAELRSNWALPKTTALARGADYLPI